MSLKIEDMKGPVTETRGNLSEIHVSTAEIQTNVFKLSEDIRSVLEEVENKPKAANKIFGVDRMTEGERKAALRKATLVRSFLLPVEQKAHSYIGPFSCFKG